ncbi:DUF262 domain-containing protein [Hyphobacterium sp. HN65]|uniref:DUF262 domain-containing protein n=1 Tax=Hyphobacterium lacteum TaxID=3116575 RepID=A0ABU7LR72_9PROT|nr:DUF262 domain-containing protein [Hyphobacterium sp. HN65]MEE2526412.1 DUF262 domain-containing protein [Hyphobacterium sp. HN65]
MVNTNLEQYTIADFIQWDQEKSLTLNPYFQRKGVWTPAAKTYLIDTILNDMPIPKIYIRSKIDLETQKSIRDVVDGQQRLRAILDFARSKFRLTPRSKHFKGLSYDKLSDELKQQFLGYSLSVDHLLNANDEDVLEIFARLNSYSVVLNPPEKRHAKFHGDFKWLIVELTKKWSVLWEEYNLVSLSQRTRMMDYSYMAELFGIILEGVKDGGQANINKLYQKHDKTTDGFDEAIKKLDKTLSFLLENFEAVLSKPLTNQPHFLMFFAAVAFHRVGIPEGDIAVDQFGQLERGIQDIEAANANVATLADYIENDSAPKDFTSFLTASSETTQRIKSRRIRFPIYVKALAGQF